MKFKQKFIGKMVLEIFGPSVWNGPERAKRVLEEALELAQAEGVSRGDIETLTTRVLGRPASDRRGEVGDLGYCLFAYCECVGISLYSTVLDTISKVSARTPEYWQERHARKMVELEEISERLKRDERFSAVEPDGSYGLCWKRVDPFNNPSVRCTRRAGHTGICEVKKP